jgi:hypothetical protein
MTYNKYLTEGIESDEIKVYEVDGVRFAKVRKPRPNEEIVGYVNFSGFLAERTLTEDANQ